MKNINKLPNNILALASIMQATVLIEELANHGRCDSQGCDASIGSLSSGSTNIDEVYSNKEDLVVGVKALKEVLEQTSKNKEILLRALSLIKLEKKLMRESEMLERIASGIDDIKKSTYYDIKHNKSVEKLANIYKNSISHLSPIIRIQGEKTNLKNENVANHIRALLLAGIRSVSLWRGQGGNMLQLFLQKKNIISQLKQIEA